MSAERHVPEPGELVYPPKPSWAPAIFAFAAALTVCGIFAEGFMVRGWIYWATSTLRRITGLRWSRFTRGARSAKRSSERKASASESERDREAGDVTRRLFLC